MSFKFELFCELDNKKRRVFIFLFHQWSILGIYIQTISSWECSPLSSFPLCLQQLFFLFFCHSRRNLLCKLLHGLSFHSFWKKVATRMKVEVLSLQSLHFFEVVSIHCISSPRVYYQTKSRQFLFLYYDIFARLVFSFWNWFDCLFIVSKICVNCFYSVVILNITFFCNNFL